MFFIKVITIFYSILTSVSNSHFINNLNDEEMTTSHLMCTFYDKNMLERKKTFHHSKIKGTLMQI